jgi:transposase-like protein
VAKRRYTKEFREFAVERLRGCENIVALARELHVSRRQLYRWRDELDPEIAGMEVPGQNARTSTQRKEVNHVPCSRPHPRLVMSAANFNSMARVSFKTVSACGFTPLATAAGPVHECAT